MRDKLAWTAYLTSFALTLAYKYGRAVYNGRKQGKTVYAISAEWFWEASAENTVSWVATITSCLAMGGIYIDRIVEIPLLSAIPVHWAIAAFLASLTEFWAPNFSKWLLSKLPGA